MKYLAVFFIVIGALISGLAGLCTLVVSQEPSSAALAIGFGVPVIGVGVLLLLGGIALLPRKK